MIEKFLEILGLRTFEKRVEDYVSLQKEMDILKAEIDNLAEIYQEQESLFKKSIESPENKNIVEIIQERQTKFRTNHINDIAALKGRYKSIDSKILDIEREYPKIKEAAKQIKEQEAFSQIRKAYDSGSLSFNMFNDIIKAKKGKVHYSDTVVFNEKGEILLLKRRQDSEFAPNAYGLPGGHVDLGENFEQAAIRELNEETGIQLGKDQVIEEIGKFEDSNVEIHYFQVRFDKTPEVVIYEEEHEYSQWVNHSNFVSEEMIPGLYDNLAKIYKWEYPIVDIKKSESNDFTEDQLKELIEEHEKLIPLLEKYIDKDEKIKAEYEKQKKELEGYKESLKSYSSIKKAFESGIVSEEIFKKARSGVYKNTLQNRKLNRVGQKYGSKQLKEVLSKIEKEIVNLDYEHGYCFDVEGKEVFNHTDYLPNKINIPANLYPKLHKNIFTHNHPVWKEYEEIKDVGSPISLDDIKVACSGRVFEVRSVSGIKIYSLKKANGDVFKDNDLPKLEGLLKLGGGKVFEKFKKKTGFSELETVQSVHILNDVAFSNTKDYIYKIKNL